jgi:hypothetical protein
MPILSKWESKTKTTCPTAIVKVFTECNIPLKFGFEYAWWDLVRLYNNLNLIVQQKKPIVHVDIDCILQKDITPLVNLPYDLIFSKEIGGDQAFPKECSQKLGFGICTGFHILKLSASKFMLKILNLMNNHTYKTYSDQVTLMNYIVNTSYEVKDEILILDGISYTNKILKLDGLTICVLDFNIIIRDPILNGNQFGNHINIDNVGGPNNFLRYFDEDLEKLPLTCRCGKARFGDTNVCKHIELRKK